MSSKIFADLHNILAKLYPDEVSIRRIVADSDLDIRRITFNSNAVNNWYSVLAEAEKVHRIKVLLAIVEGEYGKNPEFKSVYMAYCQLTDRNEDRKTGSVDTYLQTPTIPQRQRLPAVVVGLLLVGVAAGSWYWGVFGLLKWGDAMLTAIPTVSGIEPAKTSTDKATVTLTQTSVLSLTSIHVLPNSTPTAPTILRSTAVATPMPTSVSSYPCEAEVISSNGAQSVNTLRAKPSVTSPSRGALDVGTKVQVTQRDEDEIVWYRIMENGSSLGWIPAENLHLSTACPK